MEAELVAYGKLHGLAGTDHRRRDIMVALMGCTCCPVLCLQAAVGSSLATMMLALWCMVCGLIDS